MAAASAVIVHRRNSEKAPPPPLGSAPENTLAAILSEADVAASSADAFLPAGLESDAERTRRTAARTTAAMETFLATHAVETEGGHMYFLAKSKISQKLVAQMRAVVEKRKGFTSLVFFLLVPRRKSGMKSRA